jgi:AraC-like DNA-binding protein
MAEAPESSASHGELAGGRVRRSTFGGVAMEEVAYASTTAPIAGDFAAAERRCLVFLQLTGDVVFDHGGTETPLRTGNIAIVNGEPARWWSASGDVRQLRLHLPPAWLRSRLPMGRIPAIHILDGRAGLGRMLANLLDELPDALRDAASSFDLTAQAAVRDAVVALVVAALSASDPGCAEIGHRIRTTAVRRWPAVCAFIEARLPEPSLCPADVARAHGISTRQLHRLFHQAGTSFGAFLRDLRLARCRADFSDPRCAALPVTAIAYRWGFSDSAHFSRSFRAAYGTTARAFRSRVSRLPQFTSEAPGSDRRARSFSSAAQISPASGDEGSA